MASASTSSQKGKKHSSAGARAGTDETPQDPALYTKIYVASYEDWYDDYERAEGSHRTEALFINKTEAMRYCAVRTAQLFKSRFPEAMAEAIDNEVYEEGDWRLTVDDETAMQEVDEGQLEEALAVQKKLLLDDPEPEFTMTPSYAMVVLEEKDLTSTCAEGLLRMTEEAKKKKKSRFTY